MLLGYTFGGVLESEPARRRRWMFALGLGASALFLLLRGGEWYGDPRTWREATQGPRALPGIFAFLETSKYPASLQFLLMTLGPALALLPWLERLRGPLGRVLALLGRVPLFFYLLHLPVIHALALGVSLARSRTLTPWLFENHPMGNGPAPDGYRWSLPLLYAVWVVAMVLLTLACRWFAGVKARSHAPWLRYL
jgi:uncharacterized membrane protein